MMVMMCVQEYLEMVLESGRGQYVVSGRGEDINDIPLMM